jgi:hypothetical protein
MNKGHTFVCPALASLTEPQEPKEVNKFGESYDNAGCAKKKIMKRHCRAEYNVSN